MRWRSALALAATLILAPLAAKADDAWRTFHSAERGFSVEAPGDPQHSQTQSKDGAAVDVWIIESNSQGVIIVMVSTIAPGVTKGGALLDQTVAGMAKDPGKTLVSSTPVKVKGADARDIVVKVADGGMLARDRLVFSKGVLFQVIIMTKQADPPMKDAERVLRSFRLIK